MLATIRQFHTKFVRPFLMLQAVDMPLLPVQLGCNDQTAQNISYFQSPNYPAALRTKLTCTFTVALRWNVRQVLLEFIFFEMGPPTEGNCLGDQLIVTVQNGYQKWPVLCGINSGQHRKCLIAT